MRMRDLIARKRAGGALTAKEIAWIVRGCVAGEIPEYQVSALLMAIVFQGMSDVEVFALTESMLASGATLDLSHHGKPVADKHSTGGVGDKTSLVVAPIVASAGLLVPMISGRALGHSGGTLDKLEAIPGFRTDLRLDELQALLAKNGVGLIGQTDEIAPADRRIYALRDATATVVSTPLIVASIMSKKLAEGLDALVLDVKVGSGAFMKSHTDARKLAELLVNVGSRCGTRVQALMTSMDEPLGRAAGNSLEVEECIRTMQGDGPDDLVELSIELAARMLMLGRSAQSDALEDARREARTILDSGAALDRFRRIVEAQGGDPRVADDPSRLERAPVEMTVRAWRGGYVASKNCEVLGHIVAALGAGRRGVNAAIDRGVGLVVDVRIGDEVREGDAICRIVARTTASAEAAARRIPDAYAIENDLPMREPLIREIVVPEGAPAAGGS
jgi:pyrimidine-nucleoside phosphorylase